MLRLIRTILYAETILLVFAWNGSYMFLQRGTSIAARIHDGRHVENGAKVIIFDVDERTGSSLAAELPEDLFFIKCDVSKKDDVKRSVESAIDKFDKIDCLINNAGIYALFGEIDSIPLEDFQKIIRINLLGYFLVSKHTLPHLRQTKGNIVNMASIGGHNGFHGSLAYSTTKGGVLAMTKALAIDEAKNGVRVNSVSPGAIWTSMLEEYHKQLNDEQLLNNMKGFSDKRSKRLPLHTRIRSSEKKSKL